MHMAPRRGGREHLLVKQDSVLRRRESTVFGITARVLLTLNNDNQTASNLEALEDQCGVEGLAELLHSNIDTGLPATDNTELRVKEFGQNYMPTAPPKTWFSLFLQSFDDATLIILIVSALVSLGVGVYSDPKKGWIEGVAILCAVVVVATVTATNDYSKDKQFRALTEVRDNITVRVIRAGEHLEISTRLLMVGDLVVLENGDKIPCDGILVRGDDVTVNESSLTGEPEDVRKGTCAAIMNGGTDGSGASFDAPSLVGYDPFLLSGCVLTGGHCTMLSIAVGAESRWGRIKARLSDDPTDTPLQEKLDELAGLIGYVGMAAAAATFVATMAVYFMDPTRVIESDHLGEKVDTLFEHVLHAFIIAVTIVVVAVPEGLPLAVTISLAYSTKKMLKDNNLIRVLAACETMGNATNICSDKTGTLTENRMTVVAGWVAGQRSDEGLPVGLSQAVTDIVAEGIAVNTTARLRTDAESSGARDGQEVIGNKTEGALLMMLRSIGQDYAKLRAERLNVDGDDRVFSFSSARKRMSTLIHRNTGNDARLYCKGAAEMIVDLATHVLGPDGKPHPLTEADRAELKATIQDFAERALRAVALSHVDRKRAKGGSRDLTADEVEQGLCLDAIFGIKDPLRADVKEAVRQCQEAGIMVRMVTGDNPATAKAIAQECGILHGDGIVMEGPDFRRMSLTDVDRILPRLQVLARSSPNDKYLLVSRLNGKNLPADRQAWEQMHPELDWHVDKDTTLPGYREEWESSRPDGGEVVGATGDGTNDAPALKVADVGLSMGLSGTDVAKDASDIVIMDDRFSSIVKAVLWGRSVFDNIRKFLQFQLTVNVVALTVTFLGAVAGYEPPLNAVMMLWVNLIMDTMGALALGTEPPTPPLLRRRPLKRTAPLIDRIMWKHVFVQSAYQLVILTWLLLKGASFFKVKDASQAHFTIIFNSFVFCQIFNEFNARSITNSWDVLKGISSNPMFQAVILFTVLGQWLIVQYGEDFTRTDPLTVEQWLASVLCGAMALPLGVIMRMLPPRTHDPTQFAGYVYKDPAQVKRKGSNGNDDEASSGLLSAIVITALPVGLLAAYMQYFVEDGLPM